MSEKITLFRVVATILAYKYPPGQPPQPRFLITKRSSKVPVAPGKWTIPGGGIEMDDFIDLQGEFQPNQWYHVLERGARRELKEETGLEVGKLKHVIDLVFLRPDGLPVMTHTYLAPWISGEVKLCHESQGYAWVTLAGLDQYDLIPGIKHEIEEAARLFTTVI